MKRIALVEDNPDNRLLVQAILNGQYEVDEYENGADALAGIAAQMPDLILLDISLPGMDGTEVLKRLRMDSRMAELPVIALTAHAMSGDRERFMKTGFDAYLTKPIVDEEVLLAAIRQFVD